MKRICGLIALLSLTACGPNYVANSQYGTSNLKDLLARDEKICEQWAYGQVNSPTLETLPAQGYTVNTYGSVYTPQTGLVPYNGTAYVDNSANYLAVSSNNFGKLAGYYAGVAALEERCMRSKGWVEKKDLSPSMQKQIESQKNKDDFNMDKMVMVLTCARKTEDPSSFYAEMKKNIEKMSVEHQKKLIKQFKNNPDTFLKFYNEHYQEYIEETKNINKKQEEENKKKQKIVKSPKEQQQAAKRLTDEFFERAKL